MAKKSRSCEISPKKEKRKKTKKKKKKRNSESVCIFMGGVFELKP
jgi:hypothetical protein